MKLYNASITGDVRPHIITSGTEGRIKEWVKLQLPGVKLPDKMPTDRMVIDEAEYQLTITPLESASEVSQQPLPPSLPPDDDSDLISKIITPVVTPVTKPTAKITPLK